MERGFGGTIVALNTSAMRTALSRCHGAAIINAGSKMRYQEFTTTRDLFLRVGVEARYNAHRSHILLPVRDRWHDGEILFMVGLI